MASQSVLELAVSTGKWDSGLKKAQSTLSNFISANGGLQQALGKDAGKMKTFVQMMGGMESKAKTGKGQMNDYKSAIEQLTMQYNRMTEAQQNTIGQDYLQAIEQMKQKYRSVNEEIQEMNRSLKGVEMPEMKGGGLFSGMGNKMSGALHVFAGNMLTNAAGAVAQLGSETLDAVKQGIELAKAGEGIRIAFSRLNDPNLLKGLREATHGTVTDIDLMKAAVKFDDFKLPVSELGTMLAFAQKKAKDTGQSVDYMVDSIVTGLGRKSLMILDNLGLSATEVKERMKDTGDMTKAVGEIIREQMQKSGDYVETAADRAAQANVSVQNKLEELGRKFAPLEEASSSLWTSMKLGILDVVGGPLATLLSKLTEAGRLMNAYRQMGGEDKVGRMVGNLANAKDPKSLYAQQVEKFWRYINPREQRIKDIRAWQGGERSEALGKRINAIREQYGSLDATKIQAEVDAAKKQLTEYQNAAKTILQPVKVDINTGNAVENIESLTVKLAELEAQRKNAIMAGDQDLAKSLTKQINQTKSLIKALDPNALKAPKTIKELLPVGSVAALNKELQELQKQQTMVTTTAEWDRYQKKIKEVTEQIKVLKGELGIDALRNVKPVSVNDMIKDNMPTREKLIKRGQEAMDNFKVPEPEKRDTLKDARDMVSGLQSVSSGLQQMGIELPEGVQKVIGVVQGIMNVIQGVQTILQVFGTSGMTANTTAVLGNTAALGALTGAVIANTAAINANTVTPSIFAGGGIVRAAGGFRVPGNSFSGDRVPALLNSGELVLNTGQQEVVAQALLSNNRGERTHNGNDYVSGQNVFIGTNNYLRGAGQGQLVTTRMLRQYGLIH